MQVGIIDYLLRVREEACFYMAAQLGFDCIEMTVDQVRDPSALLFESIRSIDELSSSSGVAVSSLYAAYFLKRDLFVADEKQRQVAFSALRAMMKTAVRYRIPAVVIPMYGASHRDEDSDRVAADVVFSRVAEWEESASVRLALKTSLSPERLLELIGRHDAAKIGVCFDPGNVATLDRDPAAELAELSDRLVSIHLKDRGTLGESTSLGAGRLDLPALFEALGRIDFSGPIVLETPTGRSAVDSAQRNLQTCRRFAA